MDPARCRVTPSVNRSSIRTQLKSNLVAIVSVAIALASFSYTTWRNERSEHNRTMRQAAFQLLTALGEMQQLVYHAHYDHDAERGNPRTGWVYVDTINDFSATMPAPVPARAEELLVAWRDHWENLGRKDTDAEAISDAVDRCRSAVVEAIKALH
ncbi:MAG TPA: hypothetical protein VN790_10320 [Steroidobacteraceae bacterium]|nr:hypothetical protein [Steroidobacteraceae bacterium]